MRKSTSVSDAELASGSASGLEGLVGVGRSALVLAEIVPGSAGSRARVVLRYDGNDHVGQASGQADDLTLTARATVAALESAIGCPGYLHLVGCTRMTVFELPAIVVSIRTTAEPPLTLLGAVPADRDLIMCAARAVLKATNRVVAS